MATRPRFAARLFALSMAVALVIGLATGCGATFPAAMDGTRIAINETGKIMVEPALEKMCVAVAKKCKADGVAKDAVCKPDDECRAKIKLYDDAAATVLDSVAKLNRIWYDLKAAGLLK
jgi:hypothetical protein